MLENSKDDYNEVHFLMTSSPLSTWEDLELLSDYFGDKALVTNQIILEVIITYEEELIDLV